MVDHLLLDFTAENDIPVLRFSFDGTGFHHAYRRIGFLASGEFDFEGSNLGEADPLILGQRKARLWEREGIIAPVALVARIAGRFSRCDATEERLICFVHAS